VSIAKNDTLLSRNQRVFEDPKGVSRGVSSNIAAPMPGSDAMLFSDTFEDGLLHGWMPSHFGGDLPQMPLSVVFEPDAGLFLSTGSIYNPLTGQCAAYKRLAPPWSTGIVSFSVWYTFLDEVTAGQASAETIEFDIQNNDSSFRMHPALQISNPGDGTSYYAKIADDTQTFRTVAQIPNPSTGSTSNTTKGLVIGGNENKGNQSYLRLSVLLGNLFQANGSQNNPATGVPWVDADITAHYYEIAMGNQRFDLRATQTTDPGRGKTSTQGGSLEASFAGSLNAGITLSQLSTATGAAQMLVTKAACTFHPLDSNGKGWLG
jgi:hypothetical protein